MRSGDLVLQGGAIVAAHPSDLPDLLVVAGGTVGLPSQWSIRATGGVRAGREGSVDLRDAAVALRRRAWDDPERALDLGLGLSVPTSPSAWDGLPGPVSTASPDPLASVDLLLGGTWVGVVSARGQFPVVAGFDGVRQGPFGRLDLRLARRVAFGVLQAGLSGAAQADGEARGFRELAAVAGALVEVDPRRVVALDLRLPLSPWGDPYAVAVGLVVRRAVPREPAHHHPGDGHDHDGAAP